eukprot:7289130-Alexandrium_andersonii.AAC.1
MPRNCITSGRIRRASHTIDKAHPCGTDAGLSNKDPTADDKQLRMRSESKYLNQASKRPLGAPAWMPSKKM